MSSFIAAGLFALTSSTAAVAAVPHSGIPAGYYLGQGDGAVVVFHVLPGGKQGVLAPVETGPDSSSTYSPQSVKKALHTWSYKGKLTEVSPGHYHFILGTQANPHSYCVHDVTVTPKGLYLQEARKHSMGCIHYHGASWGFSPPVPSRLRPYKMQP